MNKKYLPAIALLSAFASPYSFAEIETSANVSIVSNYVFRGYTFSADEVATQGGFDVSHDSGFYGGIWGTSSVDPNGEIDIYAGYSYEINDAFSIDAGIVRYHYPGDGTADSSGTTEWHLGGAWNDLSATWHKDVHADTDYYEVNYSHAFTEQFTLDLHLGHICHDDANVEAGADTDFIDYGVTLSYALNDTFSVFASGTDIDDKSQDSHFFVGLSAEF